MSKNKRITGWAGATVLTAALLLPAMASAHESPRRNWDDHPAYWVDRGHRGDHARHGHKPQRHMRHHRHGHDRDKWHGDRHDEYRRHHGHGFDDSGLRVFLGYWGRL